jgi:TolB-like protein/tetratricopeptide (TPR) repeat protein
LNRYGLAIAGVFREARRRKVFRTGALYVLGAWLALQVADVLFPGFGIPNAAIQALVWAAVLGFPVALVFGWLFDIGMGGIRRTLPLGAGETARPRALGRGDYVILGAFAAVAVLLAYRAVEDVRETPSTSTAPEVDGTAARDRVARLENSIAVLPFANISNDPENEYFCDGISEEILNKLAGIRELNVIGRTSSFAFKGSDFGIQRISQALRVRFVLQGSVRKSDGRLRISAQLLDADGMQVWSESFDREPRNVFDIQAEIASVVARTVASHLVPMADPGHQPVLAAYDHYLAGRALLHGRDAIGATRELQRAVELDPDFAEAHAELAISTILADEGRGVDRARASIDRALELKPRLLRAQAAQGLWLMQEQAPGDPVAAERVLREVLAQDPNMSDALNWLTNALTEQGRVDETRPILERAARIDPLHPAIAANLAGQFYEAGDVDGAMRLLERQLEQPKPGFMIYMTLFDFYRATGRLVELNALAKQEALSHPERPYISLGLSYTLLGDYASAEAWNTRSMHAFPDHPAPRYIAVALPTHRGRYENVGRQLTEILGSIRTPPAGAPSLDLWLIGAMLARAGEYESAIAFLEPLVDAAAPDNTYFGPAPELYGLHALAWAYLHTGADEKAARLLESSARWCDQKRTAGPLRDGLLLHRCAETSLLQGNVDRALAEFDRAVAAGWRDFYARQEDPYWAAIQDRPAYRALIEKVKADIARQRTEVARVDSGDAFAETLTAVRTERIRPSK